MSTLLIQGITIADPASDLNNRQVDILVNEGMIVAMSFEPLASEQFETFDAQGLLLSAGWLDMRANFQDPGYEYRENIDSGSEAAMHGGFTEVALLPDTNPAISTKAQVEYILHRSERKAVQLLPLAAISKNAEQNDLSEMHDLSEAGAFGFSSGYKTISDKGFLLRALLYARQLGKPVFLMSQNESIAGKAMVHEGAISVSLGLKGIPVLAEELEIASTLSLCRYSETPVHFSCLSSARGMELILQARKEGLPVTADVSIHHLAFSENDLGQFNTMMKFRPPLRSEEDRRFLVETVALNNFISVVTDHTPLEDDKKICEFDQAGYGAIGLQSCFSLLVGIYGHENLPLIIDILSNRSRKVLGLPAVRIAEGELANFTIFDPVAAWTLDESTNKSKSRNTPLWNKTLQGKVRAIFNKGQFKILN